MASKENELEALTITVAAMRSEVNEKLETIGDHLNDVQLDLIERLERLVLGIVETLKKGA